MTKISVGHERRAAVLTKAHDAPGRGAVTFASCIVVSKAIWNLLTKSKPVPPGLEKHYIHDEALARLERSVQRLENLTKE